ncbi:MAG: hypothetical protein WDW38_005730 [Sanguina aurantia]
MVFAHVLPQAALAQDQVYCNTISSISQCIDHTDLRLQQVMPASGSQHSRPVNGQASEGKKRKRCSPADVMCDSHLSDSFTSISTPTQDLLPHVSGREFLHHQLAAVRWLIALRSMNMNSILSDECAGDRQLEALGLISHIVRSGQSNGPCLVIAHASSHEAWQHAIDERIPDVVVHNRLGSSSSGSSSSTHRSGRLAVPGPCADPPTVLLVAPEAFSGGSEQGGSSSSSSSSRGGVPGTCLSQCYSHVVIDTAGGCGVSPATLQCLLDRLPGLTVTLLTDVQAVSALGLSALWPLLQLLLPPEQVHTLRTAVTDLDQRMTHADRVTKTGCIDPTHTRPVCVPLPQESLISDIAGRLNMLLHRFVLTRAMGDTPDMSAPRRASTLNLYDFFAAAGADR